MTDLDDSDLAFLDQIYDKEDDTFFGNTAEDDVDQGKDSLDDMYKYIMTDDIKSDVDSPMGEMPSQELVDKPLEPLDTAFEDLTMEDLALVNDVLSEDKHDDIRPMEFDENELYDNHQEVFTGAFLGFLSSWFSSKKMGLRQLEELMNFNADELLKTVDSFKNIASEHFEKVRETSEEDKVQIVTKFITNDGEYYVNLSKYHAKRLNDLFKKLKNLRKDEIKKFYDVEKEVSKRNYEKFKKETSSLKKKEEDIVSTVMNTNGQVCVIQTDGLVDWLVGGSRMRTNIGVPQLCKLIEFNKNEMEKNLKIFVELASTHFENMLNDDDTERKISKFISTDSEYTLNLLQYHVKRIGELTNELDRVRKIEVKKYKENVEHIKFDKGKLAATINILKKKELEIATKHNNVAATSGLFDFSSSSASDEDTSDKQKDGATVKEIDINAGYARQLRERDEQIRKLKNKIYKLQVMHDSI